MKAAEFRACHGEAHTNPHIDNCMLCAPFWGRIAVCGDCGDRGARLRLSATRKTGLCPECGSRLSVPTSTVPGRAT